MRVLLIKTSSMGDIIHTLPALTDAGEAHPGIIFDWVVEDIFSAIPTWHPRVNRVIPVALRRWRKGVFSQETRAEWKQLRLQLHAHHYDLILDAQGLVKSAFLTFFAKGIRAGLNFKSARESLASFAYQKKYEVNFYQHAIVRMRSLFSHALQYSVPDTPPNFNLDLKLFTQTKSDKYIVFLHGTSWTSKQWPESYWQKLALLAQADGFRIKISGGDEEEVKRAERIAKTTNAIDVLPRISIADMAALLSDASAAIAVDTGFGHLAAALNIPTVSLYGSTNPEFTGALGKNSVHLAADFSCAPCYDRVCTFKGPTEVTPACFAGLSPARVWEKVRMLLRGQTPAGSDPI